MITAERYHDFSCGHRVHGHEGKCRGLHGHNYRITFVVRGEASALDALGRVVDFSVIKDKLCGWLEDNWDHRFLLWGDDPFFDALSAMFAENRPSDPVDMDHLQQSIIRVPFNPTAENMAEHLLHVVGPQQLRGSGVKLIRVRVEETRKCSAVAEDITA